MHFTGYSENINALATMNMKYIYKYMNTCSSILSKKLHDTEIIKAEHLDIKTNLKERNKIDEIWVCQDWEYRGFFTSNPILKITVIFSIYLQKYVITQIHACREENKPGPCQILIWLKRGSSLRKEDENDQGSDRGKMCFVFCGASSYFFSISSYSKCFSQPCGIVVVLICFGKLE